MNPSIKRFLFFGVPVLVSLIIVIVLIKFKSEPLRSDASELAVAVRTMNVEPVNIWPKVSGYGLVEPGKTWQAIAQTGGKIIARNEKLFPGSFISAEEELIRIDPQKAELALAKALASIDSCKMKLVELEVTKKNLEASIAIEKKNLDLTEKNLERSKQLLAKKAEAQASVDQKYQVYYQQLAKVQVLRNSVATIPVTEKLVRAEMAVYKAAETDALFEIKNSIIQAPFDCRVVEVKVEIDQYVQAGSILIKADSVNTARIRAQIPLDKMRSLVSSWSGQFSASASEKIPHIDKLKACVIFKGLDFENRWDAKVIGGDSQLDFQARTLGVIVEVENPYERMHAQPSPPLMRNMFCEVVIMGPMLPDSLVIPRSALHNGHIYVLDDQSRLKRQNVSVILVQEDFLLVSGEIQAGDPVVVSDLIPAIDGMLLKPVLNPAVIDNIRKASANIYQP